MFSPDAFFPVLEKIARLLDDCGIRYHLTGGLVAVHYAEPRLTQDADRELNLTELLEEVLAEPYEIED